MWYKKFSVGLLTERKKNETQMFDKLFYSSFCDLVK
jgi:hypothetical protein